MTSIIFTQKAYCVRCKKWLDWYTYDGVEKCHECISLDMNEAIDKVFAEIALKLKTK